MPDPRRILETHLAAVRARLASLNGPEPERHAGDDEDLVVAGEHQELATRDPRIIGGAEKFDEYPYYGTPQKPAARVTREK